MRYKCQKSDCKKEFEKASHRLQHEKDSHKQEPTIEQLKIAWNDVFHCYDFTPSRSEALEKLLDLRIKKTTWIGLKENELRFSIDLCLDELKKGWRIKESSK